MPGFVSEPAKAPVMPKKYVRFDFAGKSDSGKTSVWAVANISEQLKLGEIRWFGRWREYCFFPEPSQALVFSKGCLQDVAEFIASQMKTHRDSMIFTRNR